MLHSISNNLKSAVSGSAWYTRLPALTGTKGRVIFLSKCMGMQSLDESHRALLENVKSMHSNVKHAINNDSLEMSMLKKLKTDLAQIHKDLATARRQAEMQKEEHAIVVAIMREEMRDELVEREAVSARTAERFRAFCGRGAPAVHSAFDRAAHTASSIEACVNSLSCESLNCSGGTALLYQKAMENA